MSDICSDNERYGGFGAVVANLLHCRDRAAPTGAEAADVAAPAPAVAAAQSAPAPAVAAARSGTKKSPPVAVAERTWLTKRPYKRQKKTLQPAAVPAPTTAPQPAAASVPFSLDEPIHPSCILIKVVGTTVSCQGRPCKEHKI